MSYEEVIFWFVAALTVVSALGVVTAQNVMHSALFLILSLIAVAGIFILLAAEFLAVVQVLVYGGAVTILILFAMMLTRVRDIRRPLNGPQAPLAALASTVFMVTSIVAVTTTDFPGESTRSTSSPPNSSATPCSRPGPSPSRSRHWCSQWR